MLSEHEGLHHLNTRWRIISIPSRHAVHGEKYVPRHGVPMAIETLRLGLDCR